MTITHFAQLRAYWWNPGKKGTPPVQLKLRDLRPLNTTDERTSLKIKRLQKEMEIDFLDTSG